MTSTASQSDSAALLGAEFQFQQDRCRSITINISMEARVHEKAEEVQRYCENHGYKYVVGKELCKSGQQHLEIALYNADTSASLKRDIYNIFKEYKPQGQYWYHNRLHKGSQALIKLGYAMKENNYITNLTDEMIEEAQRLFEESKTTTVVARDVIFDTPWLVYYSDSVTRRNSRYKEQLLGKYARGEIDRSTYFRFSTPQGYDVIHYAACLQAQDAATSLGSENATM